MVEKVWDMFTRLDTIHQGEGQTDRRTDTAQRHKSRRKPWTWTRWWQIKLINTKYQTTHVVVASWVTRCELALQPRRTTIQRYFSCRRENAQRSTYNCHLYGVFIHLTASWRDLKDARITFISTDTKHTWMTDTGYSRIPS